ncbi:MAG TPA: hypothetical protein DHW78_06445 [Ruminococcaceae bacterium]|jgi:hypothetical protein|nr:hypothetical protein [Oscillospiraceae bacterium]HCC02628.1 hypothetical protein [Oscillospiraceae bacterium]HCM23942.1 hypothetical protein [Oscillospiraceae bacterium]
MYLLYDLPAEKSTFHRKKQQERLFSYPDFKKMPHQNSPGIHPAGQMRLFSYLFALFPRRE